MENAKHAAQERPIARRLVTFVTAVAACVALVAGGTLAYFSAEETAHNVITTGGVDIELVETMLDESGKEIPFANQTGVMPGETVSKIVTVENTGESAAYVRVKVAKSFESAGGASELDDSVVGIAYNEADWTKDAEGWWRYDGALEPGEATTPLFSEVSFAPGVGNAYQGGKAIVAVSAQAVQAANNGATALDAAGWTTSNAQAGN